MATLSHNVEDYYAWVKAHRDELIAKNGEGNHDASAVISTYNMMVRRADPPTAGVFMGAVDCYIQRYPEEAKDVQENPPS